MSDSTVDGDDETSPSMISMGSRRMSSYDCFLVSDEGVVHKVKRDVASPNHPVLASPVIVNRIIGYAAVRIGQAVNLASVNNTFSDAVCNMDSAGIFWRETIVKRQRYVSGLALLQACCVNIRWLVARLLDAGLPCNSVTDSRGRSPLHLAVLHRRGRDAAIIRFLLRHGACASSPRDKIYCRSPLLTLLGGERAVVRSKSRQYENQVASSGIGDDDDDADGGGENNSSAAAAAAAAADGEDDATAELVYFLNVFLTEKTIERNQPVFIELFDSDAPVAQATTTSGTATRTNYAMTTTPTKSTKIKYLIDYVITACDGDQCSSKNNENTLIALLAELIRRCSSQKSLVQRLLSSSDLGGTAQTTGAASSRSSTASAAPAPSGAAVVSRDTPLTLLASRRHRVNAIRFLVGAGAPMHTGHEVHAAIRAGLAENVRVFIELLLSSSSSSSRSSSNVNATTSPFPADANAVACALNRRVRGVTALHLACWCDEPEIVALCLENGANVTLLTETATASSMRDVAAKDTKKQTLWSDTCIPDGYTALMCCACSPSAKKRRALSLAAVPDSPQQQQPAAGSNSITFPPTTGNAEAAVAAATSSSNTPPPSGALSLEAFVDFLRRKTFAALFSQKWQSEQTVEENDEQQLHDFFNLLFCRTETGGRTVLHLAANSHNLDALRVVLEAATAVSPVRTQRQLNRCDASSGACGGSTPLMVLAASVSLRDEPEHVVKIAELLIKHGAEVTDATMQLLADGRCPKLADLLKTK